MKIKAPNPAPVYEPVACPPRFCVRLRMPCLLNGYNC